MAVGGYTYNTTANSTTYTGPGDTWYYVDPSAPFKAKEGNMRYLYRITVVEPKTEKIVGPFLVVAKDEKTAFLKADLPQDVRRDSDHYDFCTEVVGEVRAKKDVQKVKVVKED